MGLRTLRSSSLYNMSDLIPMRQVHSQDAFIHSSIVPVQRRLAIENVVHQQKESNVALLLDTE